MIFKKEKGQALIEALAVAMALITSLSLLISMLYLGFLWSQWDQALHETLVCQGSHSDESRSQGLQNCEQEFRRQIETGLGKPHLEWIKWKKNASQKTLQAQIQMNIPGLSQVKKFRVSKSMAWPPKEALGRSRF